MENWCETGYTTKNYNFTVEKAIKLSCKVIMYPD